MVVLCASVVAVMANQGEEMFLDLNFDPPKEDELDYLKMSKTMCLYLCVCSCVCTCVYTCMQRKG
jgi:hypothetical protein